MFYHALVPLFFYFSSSLSTIAQGQPGTVRVQGQDQVNILRHTVAVSGLPSQFGKHSHILLSRTVAPPHRIWKVVDPFTRKTLSHPDRLDWYVSDFSTDGRRTVTINAGFSCLDVGQSTARPLYWWVSRGFAELTNSSQDVGGAEVDPSTGGDGSINDMTQRCFDGRKPKDDPNYRLVEHNDQHRGNGILFTKRSLPTTVVGDNRVFDEIEKQRLAEDRSNEVIYHESGLPITVGLTFETGFRAWVPPGFRTDRTLDLIMPITPLSALTKHSGARLEEARVGEGQISTNTSILVLSVFTTGLPLLLAVWWVVKHVSDTTVKHSCQCRDLPTHEAVDRISGWNVQEKVLLFMNVFGVSILATPFALALAEGTIDPRRSVEITTGALVFYGSSQKTLSEDLNNLVAGAPYVVTSWLSVRHLGYGFVAALTGSVLLILFLAIAICFSVSKRSNEMMPGSRSRWKGFSFWKLYGSLRLLLMSFQNGEKRRYKVLLELYDDVIDDSGGVDTEDTKKEILLMLTPEMRERANTRIFRKRYRKQDQQLKRMARESLYEVFKVYGLSRTRLLCKVRMDNQARYEAAMSQSALFDHHLPREWEYVRRSQGCEEGIDYYRTNGRMPPDEALLFARLGLLSYMKYVKKVIIKEDHGPETGEYDDDGVKMTLIISQIESGYEDSEEHRDAPESVVLDNRDEVPNLFTKKIASELTDVIWKPGAYKEAVRYGGGKLYVSYVIMDEKEASRSCGAQD